MFGIFALGLELEPVIVLNLFFDSQIPIPNG